MRYLKLEDVKKQVRSLGSLALQSILIIKLGYSLSDLPDQITTGDALVIWLYHRLCNDNLLSFEQLDFVMNLYKDEIKRFGDKLPSDVKDLQTELFKTAGLLILDRLFVSMSGCEGFYHLVNGNKVDKLPRVPEQTIVYNLAAIALPRIHQILKQDDTKEDNVRKTNSKVISKLG